MDKTARRAAKAAFAERKADWAICVVRIGAQVWVSAKPDAAALQRRLGFSLRSGGEGGPGMRAAFAAAGALEVEVVETLDGALTDLARETRIKTRLAHWSEALGGAVF